MEITLDFTKSAQENANDYFSKAKKARHKRERAEQIIVDLEKRLSEVEAHIGEAKQEKVVKLVVEKKWYEKFHWFRTSTGLLAIGGRDAQQNELLNSSHCPCFKFTGYLFEPTISLHSTSDQ